MGRLIIYFDGNFLVLEVGSEGVWYIFILFFIIILYGKKMGQLIIYFDVIFLVFGIGSEKYMRYS